MDFTNLVELFTKIDAAIDQDEPGRALRLILANFEELPDPAPLRERAARLLSDDDRLEDARRIYKITGLHYANAGHPARAISVGKKLEAIGGDTTFLFDQICSLYSLGSELLDRTERHSSVGAPDSDFELDVDDEPDETLYEEAANLAAESDPLQREPIDPLPAIPLLSQMPEETLERVLDALEHRIFSEFGPVVDEETPPKGLVWAVSPDLTIGEDDPTYRLNPGTLLGLESVDTDEPEVDQEIYARDGSETLDLPFETIDELSEEFDDFETRLVNLKQHAFTEALLETHPLFEAVDSEQREDLLSRFTGLRLEEGTEIIEQGVQSPGIFLILRGAVDIVRDEEETEVDIRSLGRGEVFGEVGLVSDRPTQARAIAREPSYLLHLPTADFQSCASDHPGLAKFAVNLAQDRIDATESLLAEREMAED